MSSICCMFLDNIVSCISHVSQCKILGPSNIYSVFQCLRRLHRKKLKENKSFTNCIIMKYHIYHFAFLRSVKNTHHFCDFYKLLQIRFLDIPCKQNIGNMCCLTWAGCHYNPYSSDSTIYHHCRHICGFLGTLHFHL